MFQLCYNISVAIHCSIYHLLLTIITGKLPKISYYHFEKDSLGNNFFNICNDKFIKTNYKNNVSNDCKRLIIKEYIDSLHNDEYFKNAISSARFPIFNGKEIIGNSNSYSVMSDFLDKNYK
jgi:hypothetical protein